MKLLLSTLALIVLLTFPFEVQAQLLVANDNYNNCAAIFYKGKILVNEFSPNGTCKLETGMEGKMTVSAVSLSEKGAVPIQQIGFQVAIQNNRTNTLFLLSKEEQFEIELKDILDQCEEGDQIIFLTTDKEFSLPHHMVTVWGGC